MDSATALREFLEYIIGQLIEQPEEGAIAHEWSDDGHHHRFVVTLTEDDMGHIIGKNGHTVAAIRSLLGAAAQRDGETVSLRVVGPSDLELPHGEHLEPEASSEPANDEA